MKCSKCGFLRANEDGSCPSCGAGPTIAVKPPTVDKPKRGRKRKAK